MDTKEPAQPAPCATDIYEKGECVMITHSIRSFNLEPWVQKVAALSGQPVDWHFSGGRAVILALGDLKKVHAAIQELLLEHNELQREACQLYVGDRFKPSYTLYGAE